MRILFITLLGLKLTANATDLEPRIVQGIPVKSMKKFGYTVHFVSNGEERVTCGGSIVNQRTILTAAHCICDAPDQEFFIRVGSYHKNRGTLYNVKNTVVHERYDPIKLLYDIGLAVVDRDIRLGSEVYRVALSNTPPRAGLVGTIAGWGVSKREVNGPIKGAHALLYTKQKILPLYKCKKIMKIEVRPKTFCAGAKNASSYPWRGDSGGALVVDGSLQVGVLSAHAAPGVTLYTDVSQFLQWIDLQARRLYCQ
ncbi:trypsin epsilon-like [Aricia agestis]|uniref:trypsin epsilon-like n=1 Tax=Aricia agestis TaxID=91739 RepID=UPI001C20AA8B|nr:trypsin epsilon-like [Aricia agestis]